MEALGNFIGSAVILLIGLVLRTYNASGLIAGYNTMSEEEKSKWDERAMSRFIGDMLIISAAVLLLCGILYMLSLVSIAYIFASWGIFMLILIFVVIYLNISPKFKK